MADPVTLGIVSTGLAVAGGMARMASFNEAFIEERQDIKDQVSEYGTNIKDAWSQANPAMKNMVASNIYQIGGVATQAKQSVGALASKQGFSGVRGNSPLMAMKQQEELAGGAVKESVRQANSQLFAQGRETSILTRAYQRKIDLLNKKYKKMGDDFLGMSVMNLLGAAPDVANSLNWLDQV